MYSNKIVNQFQNLKDHGFTIIEVLIALAIGGLIMVITIQTAAHVQRSQRDSSRQRIVNSVKSEMDDYAKNNKGVYPLITDGQNNYYGQLCNANTTGCWSNFVTKYIQNHVDINDPSTGTPDINTTDNTHGVPQPYSNSGNTLPGGPGEVAVIYGAKCAGEDVSAVGDNSNRSVNFAVVIGLERSGTKFCADNS